MPEEIVYAVHNFEAENEDEISFTSGEPIVVLEKDEKYQDGWWQGRNVRGEIGLFPENYTTSKKPQQQQQLTSPPTASSSMLSTNSSSSSSIKQSTSLFNEERYDSAISHIDLPPADKLGTSPPPPPPPLTIMQQPQQPPPTSVPPPPPPDAKATAGIGAKENPEDWSIEEVAEWLQSVGLSNVTDNFIEQEITGDILLSLTSESLKELGITAYGRRYRVMNALEKLKAEHGLQNNNNKAIDTVAPISSSSSSSSKLHTASINVDASIQQQQQPPQPPMRSPPRSPVATDSMYEFPRKAPMPPLAGANGAVASDAAFHHRRPTDSLLTTKSPASSATVSRSNTFQTLSSKVSSSSSSVRSRERSPDPARATGTFSHKLTQKSTISDSQDLDARPSIDTQNIMYSIRENGNYDQPFASDHDNIHPTSPLNTRSRNMSVASVEPSALPRMSTNSYQPPEHEGWLHKQGDKYKTWNKRWFVLKGPNLFYFKSPKDVRMKGIIHLKGYKIIADETIYPGKYSFKAKHDRERTFFFYTDTKESMRTWIKMLMKATITRDFDAPVMSSSHLATIPLDVARQMRPRPPSMIMYNKPQQQQKHGFNSGNTGGALHEEDENAVIAEEQQHAPIQDGLGSNLSELSHKQLRESGITVWPHGALGEDTPDVPDKFMFDETIPAPTLSSSIVMSDDDEDMIDPHHHKSFLPTPDSSSARVVAAPNMEKELSRSSSESFQETSNNYSSNNNNTDGQSRTWTRAQYLEWINRYLPPGKRVIDLTGAFRNGDTLILLLEALSGKTVRRPPTPKGGSVSMQMLDNIVAAFKFMGREGVVVDGRYTIKDIFGGNESKIMDMLDAIRTWSEENNFSQP